MKDELALIEAFRDGDDFAFVSLYNRYKGPVYTFCARMMLNRELAQDDAMQEAFLRVYENRSRLLKTAAFRAWLFSIARNQCLSMLRSRKRYVPLDEKVEKLLVQPPGRALEKKEQTMMVTHFLGQLKPEYREVIVLREFQNMSYAEIAAVAKSTLPAIKSRLFKARCKLAVSMQTVMRREEQRRIAMES